MKIIRLLFIFLLFLCFSCKSKFQMNERDRIADHMMLEFAETLALKGLRLSGMGGGLNHETGKHKVFGISFIMQENVTDISHARELFVETADAFISFINSREDILEYLDVFPVTIVNIDMAILFLNAQQGDIVDISNCRESLYYYTAGPDPERDPWNEICEETFEEAQAILSQTENAFLPL